ncbi:UDP-glucose 4-epimerase GalE [Pararhizobium sp.]|uniref:UDP-glucose 4-epimerase GalE n=1 Tax=Pararhizobium sp. TaxID=1977563 RepID=UPI002722FD13|nr:UDP-glucose 4-epimerase GalE [Pararhizobium sp.]MDO9416282.1 UDP-glucose 4-epimerase GalE [Pararhizobium sp.]
MTVLVTGGAGYIGSHMVWALLDAGEDVVVLDRLSTGFRWAIAPEARFYLGDVGDSAVLERIFSDNRIDAIIHFAGSIIVPQSIADPLSYYKNNTANTRTVMEAAVAAGVPHFVFSSTAAVYGTPDGEGLVKETDRLSPESPYGLSKLMSEMMLQDAAAAHALSYVALRYFNVAGADVNGRAGQSTPEATHLIKIACQAALGRRQGVNVYGTDYPTPDGTGIRDYIHVNDLVAAHLQALAYLRAGGKPLVANCGYGQGYSVLEVLETVMKVRGRKFKVNVAPRRPGDAVRVVADATIARQKLDWVPRFDSLDLIVQTALDWEEHIQRKNSYDIEGINKLLESAQF